MEESTLHDTIRSLAEGFASSLLGALRAASIDEILVEAGAAAPAAAGRPRKEDRAPSVSASTTRPPRGARPAARPVARPAARSAAAAHIARGGRLPRRSVADIRALAASIRDFVRSKKGGMRAEEIREGLGLDRREIPRALAEAVREGMLAKEGQKRATTYRAIFGAKESPKKSGAKKGVKKGAKKGRRP